MNLFPQLILAGFSILFAFASQIKYEESSAVNDDPGILAHNVYFYINEDVTAEEQKQFEAGLKALLSIDEIQDAEMGVPAETEDRDVTDNNFVYSIFLQFETMEDYEVYAEHPDHLKFIEAYEHLWADVKVFDSEITYER
jgi:antibiotic biosynthesis monooxygenase (ABM) superfamily enzyme